MHRTLIEFSRLIFNSSFLLKEYMTERRKKYEKNPELCIYQLERTVAGLRKTAKMIEKFCQDWRKQNNKPRKTA